MSTFADLTTWIPVDKAKAMIQELIDNGTYEVDQIKKSSNLFANKKNKADGYVCRVLAIKGIHPELELPEKPKKTKSPKAKKTKAKTVQVVNTEPVDTRRYVMTAELIDEKRGLFMINQGNKYWLEAQTIGSGEKKILSPVVTTDAEAKAIWLTRNRFTA